MRKLECGVRNRQNITLEGSAFELIGDRLTVGYLTLNQVMEVRILLPELN